MTIKTSDTIRTAPGALPILGHLVRMRKPLPFLMSLPDSGKLVRVMIGTKEAIVVCDRDLTRKVFQDHQTFDIGGAAYDRGREFLGNSFATCPDSEHRRKRALIQPSFTASHMPGYSDVMSTIIDKMTDSWREGQIIDVYKAMLDFTSGVTLETLLANILSSDDRRQALEDLSHISSGFMTRMVTPIWMDRFPLPFIRRYQKSSARFRTIVGRNVAEYRRNGISDDHPMMELLSATHPGHGDQPISSAEITDHCLALFVGGSASPTSSLSWALWVLSQYPDIADRVYAEVDNVLDGRAARYTDLPNLEFTGRVVTETLRKWASGWILPRVCTVDTELDGHLIPAGTQVICSTYLIQNRADYYEDPDRFDPDRWSPERAGAIDRGTHIPFGLGRRVCPGGNFGETEVMLGLATVAARWRVDQVPGSTVRTVLGLTVKPAHLKLRVTSRRP